MTQEPKIFPYIVRLLQGAEVVWKPLGEVLKRTKGTKITAGQMKAIHKDKAPVKIFAGGKTFAFVDFEDIPEKDINQKPSIIVKSRGIIEFEYYDKPFSHKNEMWSYYSENENINIKYVYYFLKQQEPYFQKLGSKMQMPQIALPDTEKFQIPLPPLSVQQEIVRILDKFTELEAELEAELEGRKRQHEYYRNKLLTFNEIGGGTEIVWKTLGEVGTFIRGNGLQKKDFVETGIGCIHYGQIYTYYGIKASETISYVTEDLAKSLRKASHNDLIIAGVSENIEDVCKCVVWEGEEDICVSGDTFIFKTEQNPHYIGHLLRTDDFLSYKRKNAIGAKVTRLQAGSLPKYTIPLPPLEEQQRIATILDKFDTLVNSISEGLPKEIALRRKQYEYYREKLLSFPS